MNINWSGLGAVAKGMQEGDQIELANTLKRLQAKEIQTSQAGQAARGNALEGMFQPQIPGAQPMPQMGGGRPMAPQPGQNFAPPPQSPAGMPPQQPGGGGPPGLPPGGGGPGGAPMPRPQTNAMPQGGAPMQQQQPGGGMGGQQQSLDWRQVIQAIRQRNPNIQPAELAAAVDQFVPMMNMQSKQEWNMLRLQLQEQMVQMREKIATMQSGDRRYTADTRADTVRDQEEHRDERDVRRSDDRRYGVDTRRDTATNAEEGRNRRAELSASTRAEIAKQNDTTRREIAAATEAGRTDRADLSDGTKRAIAGMSDATRRDIAEAMERGRNTRQRDQEGARDDRLERTEQGRDRRANQAEEGRDRRAQLSAATRTELASISAAARKEITDQLEAGRDKRAELSADTRKELGKLSTNARKEITSTLEAGRDRRSGAAEEGRDRRAGSAEEGRNRRADQSEAGRNQRGAATLAERGREFGIKEDRLERGLVDRLERTKEAARAHAQHEGATADKARALADIRLWEDAEKAHRDFVAKWIATNRDVINVKEREKIMTEERDRYAQSVKEIGELRKQYGPAGGGGGRGSTSAPAGGDTPPISALKEGHVTTFENGQKWTLKNGKPFKVDERSGVKPGMFDMSAHAAGSGAGRVQDPFGNMDRNKMQGRVPPSIYPPPM